LMNFLKPRFYSKNTLDKNPCQCVLTTNTASTNFDNNVVASPQNVESRTKDQPAFIFPFCFGMSGDLNQPGMGSINFNDLLQNLTLTITVNLSTYATGLPAGDAWKVECFALTNNIVTYDKGELMKQL